MRRASLLLLCSVAMARAAEPEARPTAAWAVGPFEARVAFDRDVPKALVDRLVGARIVFGNDVGPVDLPRGPDAPIRGRGSLRVVAARVEGGRTVVLSTDPHPRDSWYALQLPAPVGRRVSYRLRGVEYVLDTGGAGSKPLGSGVWPALDSSGLGVGVLDAALREAGRPSRLTLRTLLALPRGKNTITVHASVPFAMDLGGESVKSGPEAGRGQKAEATTEVEADVVDLTVTLDLDGTAAPSFSATYRSVANPDGGRLPDYRLVLPWAPPPMPDAPPAPVPEALLTGGDPAKGAAIFRSEGAKCATCHKAGGEGKEVGPDLAEVFGRHRSWIYGQILEPSASIHPDYVTYIVQTKDGRALAGIVRAEGADAIRVTDTEAKSTVIPRSAIEELKPSATSIMPVGLLGAVGEEGIRDLLAFLTNPPPKTP